MILAPDLEEVRIKYNVSQKNNFGRLLGVLGVYGQIRVRSEVFVALTMNISVVLCGIKLPTFPQDFYLLCFQTEMDFKELVVESGVH